MSIPDEPSSPGSKTSDQALLRARRTRRERSKRGAPRFLSRPSSRPTPHVPAPVTTELAFDQRPTLPALPETLPALPCSQRPFDEDDEKFFLAEDSLAPTALPTAASADADDDEPAPASHAARLASPRRRALLRYVGGVVACAAAFCVAAFAGQTSPSVAAAAAAANVTPAPVAIPTVAIPTVALPPVATPVAPVAFTAERAPVPSPVVDPPAALVAREVARAALSHGDLTRSVEKGTEAVELDPSDAEAWLVLGAAEMARGRDADARSSFTACTKLATRGPRHECFQMLQ